MHIEDFISPSIVQRLSMDQTIFRAQITDWRSMVDCVLIDTDFDGVTFNVVFSDVPQKKNDLAAGSYVLPIPDAEVSSATTVAVKIIDMLGEEVLVTKHLTTS